MKGRFRTDLDTNQCLGVNVTTSFSFSRSQVRHQAVDIIKQAREEEGPELRVFVVPRIQFATTDYPDLVPWKSRKSISITEPPQTRQLTAEELDAIAATGESSLVLVDVPCHSQVIREHQSCISKSTARHTTIFANKKKGVPHHCNYLGSTLLTRSRSYVSRSWSVMCAQSHRSQRLWWVRTGGTKLSWALKSTEAMLQFKTKSQFRQ